MGFSIGSQKLATTGQVTEVGHTGSVVGSVTGKTTIFAGKHYQQTGSDVLGGDGVAISGATVSIENKDIVNEAKFKATQSSVSGGGGSSGGSGSGSFQQKSDSSTSTTHTGIADGTLIVDDGSGEGMQRSVTQLQKDRLKEIFDARKVAEQLQI
jgi:hypothetical protein